MNESALWSRNIRRPFKLIYTLYLTIPPFTIGRKNWLFSGSPKGATASAAVYSLIETCKANEIDPYKYLIYLLEHLPNEPFQRQPEILQKYLPWSPEVLSNCK